MADGDRTSYDAAALDASRPRLIRFCIFMGLLTLFTLAWVAWDLTHENASPAYVLALLVAVFAVTLLGAFMIGRHRQLIIRADRNTPTAQGRAPSWLGLVLALLPGVVIVGAQALARTNSLANDLLGIVAAYLLTWLVGLSLGLVWNASPDNAG